MGFKFRAFHLLGFAAVVVVLVSLFVEGSRTVDIHVHDTYYVIGQRRLLLLAGLVVGWMWLIYLLTRKVLYSNVLSWVHVVLTVVLMTMVLSSIYLSQGLLKPDPRGYLDFSYLINIKKYNDRMVWITYGVFLFILGQVVYLVNLILGFLPQKRKDAKGRKVD